MTGPTMALGHISTAGPQRAEPGTAWLSHSPVLAPARKRARRSRVSDAVHRVAAFLAYPLPNLPGASRLPAFCPFPIARAIPGNPRRAEQSPHNPVARRGYSFADVRPPNVRNTVAGRALSGPDSFPPVAVTACVIGHQLIHQRRDHVANRHEPAVLAAHSRISNFSRMPTSCRTGSREQSQVSSVSSPHIDERRLKHDQNPMGIGPTHVVG